MDAELYGNPEAIFKRIQFCHDLEFECAIPAKIVHVYNDHTADAQPLIKLVSSTEAIDQAPVRVTTLWNFHGDFEVHHPLNVGDTGWLIAADRNTDLVKQYNCELDETQNQGAQEPNKDLNLHRYRWGFFIPDRWDKQLREKETVPEQLQDCFYIRDRNGNVEILLDEDGRIDITAKSAVEIFSDLFVHGESVFDGEALFNDDVRFKQNITVDGEALINDLLVMHDAKFDHDVTIGGSLYVNGKDSRVNDMTEQEITCVTSVTQDAQTKKTVLTLEKMKVFRTSKDHDRDVTITVPDSGGGGGGETTIYADDISIDFKTFSDGLKKLEIKHWHDEEAKAAEGETLAKTLQYEILNPDEKDPDPDKEVEVVCRDASGNVYYKKIGAMVATESTATDRMAYYVSSTTDESGVITPTINNCFVYSSRTKISCNNYTLPSGYTGSVYVKYINSISSSGEAGNTLSITTTEEYTSDTVSVYKIYDFVNGKVTADYRGAIVIPVYE